MSCPSCGASISSIEASRCCIRRGSRTGNVSCMCRSPSAHITQRTLSPSTSSSMRSIGGNSEGFRKSIGFSIGGCRLWPADLPALNRV